MKLIDAQLRAIPGLGAPQVTPAGDEVRLDAPELEPGVYTVEYSVVSASDGHQTSGLFAFAVDPTGANPPPARPTESSAPTADAAAVTARWIALAGAIVLLGVALFWLLSAMPALRATADPPDPPYWLLAGSAATSALGIVAYLALASRGLSPPAGALPFDPAAAFGVTPFALAIRVAFAATLAAALTAGVAATLGPSRIRPAVALLGIIVAGTVVLGAFSLAGHASALGGRLNGLVDWLHLLAVAAWVGALPGLLVLAVAARGGTAAGAVGSALRRHARVAVPAAAVVAASGLLNVTVVIGPARDLLGSAYGDLVLGKALLFSIVVALGAANWLVLRGRSARARLGLILAEALVGGAAILVAATMVTIPPAATRPPVTTPTGLGAAQLYGTAGETIVHLAVVRPLPGDQRYEVVTRTAADGEPRTDVQKVFVTFHAPSDSGLPDQRIELTQSEVPWLWGTRGAYTPAVGAWDVEVTVRRAGELDERVAFPLRVTAVVPPATLPAPDDGIQPPPPLSQLWRAIPPGPLGAVVAFVPLLAGGALAVGVRRGAGRMAGVAAGALLVAGFVAGVGVLSRSVVALANAAPADRASVVNPVKPTAESLASGADLYRANCSSCHGAHGGGDGPALGEPTRNLAENVPQRTDGELDWIIDRGLAGTRMPGFALTLDEADRWDLINHLRASFGRASRPP